MSSQSRAGAETSPESLLAAWLAGRAPDFEELCRAHPHSAAALRELRAQHERIERIRRAHGQVGTLAEKLGATYGGGVDPQVTLELEEGLQESISSSVLSRLAGRSPASLRYRVKGEVAQGGMGAVLRVWDEDLRRHLAMKVMLGKGLDLPSRQSDPKQLARFLEEAQVTGQLDHPGIVPVHELGLDSEGRVFFTMKLVKGQTLKEVFDELAAGEGGWTQARVLGLILKVCEAMSYAHAKGVIHRDLKPANVMVGKFGEVFVMDWGLARVLGREDAKDLRIRDERPPDTTLVRSERRELAGDTPDSPLHTMDGDIVGTPAYMSPEQARGTLSAMGAHSDVYAVGAMLYHLLAGHMPYVPPGARLNSYAVWMRVQEGPPRALEELAPQAPAELVAICERAMSRDVATRYPDMAALAADLSAYVEGRVVKAYEAGAWAEARKWVHRNRSLAAALAAAVLLLVLGLVSSLLLKAQSDANASLAGAKASEAMEQQRIANENERLAREETAKVLRLSDIKVLQEQSAAADALWPPHPARIADLESWLERGRALAARLAEHRATAAQMRARAHPWTSEERERDARTHPKAGELAEHEAEMASLIEQIEGGLSGQQLAAAEQRIAELEPLVGSLTDAVWARRTWRLDSPQEQWQHDVLTELIDGLARFESGLLAQDSVEPEHGWSVPKRLAFARELATGFAVGGEWAQAWADALPALHAAYPGLDLEPQMGLAPIGPDPDSGLWEFAHLLSGEPAVRGPDGRLEPREATGLVLVLIPGGSFWMGAQASDAAQRNFDPEAQRDEGPVHEVELSPYFLSKYEMTRAQWLRLVGKNPSFYQAGPYTPTLLHPIEQVSWQDCTVWLGRAGLALPTEAQWECAARGGTDTPWWTGAERDSLREAHAANLADQSAARAGAAWGDIPDWPELDDGYPLHAPIGSYSANPFGLHEVTGNLWEWCQDGLLYDYYAQSPERDPVAVGGPAVPRVSRGGSFDLAARFARSTSRGRRMPTYSDSYLGVRPARALDP